MPILVVFFFELKKNFKIKKNFGSFFFFLQQFFSNPDSRVSWLSFSQRLLELARLAFGGGGELLTNKNGAMAKPKTMLCLGRKAGGFMIWEFF